MHKIIKSVPALLICLAVSFSVTYAAPAVKSVQKIRVITKYSTSDEHAFNHPARLTYDSQSGNIFILDIGFPAVITVDTTGNLVNKFPKSNHPPDSLAEPSDILLFKNFLWILDRGSSRIHQYTTQGRLIGSFESGTMPFDITGLGEQLVASHLIGDEMIPFDMYTGEIPRGYTREPSKFTMVLGMLKIFSKMRFLASSPDGEIFAAYRHKNRIEKYDKDLDRTERVELTENVEIEPAVKEKSNDGKFTIYAGTMFSRDITYSANRVFVLWRVEEPTQRCLGETHISVFDRELRKLNEFTITDCLESFTVTGNLMIGTAIEPEPSIILYRLKYDQ